MTTASTSRLPIAIIGAGPVGLAAAAHLLERGITPIVFEAGASVGASVRAWSHVRMFSPWRYTVDAASVRLLDAAGWAMPPADDFPTGAALAGDYLEPLASLPVLRPHIHLNARVVAIGRDAHDKMKDGRRGDAPFHLHIAYADSREAVFSARAVIDASGTWNQPNPLGAGGLPAAGERASAAAIAYGIPDVLGQERADYAGKRVLVVGSGHSAVQTLLALAELRREKSETQITWAMRGKPLAQVYGGGTADALPERGRLGARVKTLVDDGTITLVSPFRISEIRPNAAGGVNVIGTGEGGEPLHITADRIVAATGARPALEMLRELRTDLDPALESTRALGPLIDPNIHSCGTVRPHGEAELRQPEPGFYVVGMKSYGRAPTFLLATGYEQARSVTAALAGDWEAARDVQLELPETGVCSSDTGGCCAPETAAGAATPIPGLIALSGISIAPIAVDAARAAAPISIAPALAAPIALTAIGGEGAACCGPDCCS